MARLCDANTAFLEDHFGLCFHRRVGNELRYYHCSQNNSCLLEATNAYLDVAALRIGVPFLDPSQFRWVVVVAKPKLHFLILFCRCSPKANGTATAMQRSIVLQWRAMKRQGP